MKILLHICCGPCAIMPIQRLLQDKHEVTGYFYNPNIHPLAEYLRRCEGAAETAARYDLKIIWADPPDDYALNGWLRTALQRCDEPEPAEIAPPAQDQDDIPVKLKPRCLFCLELRLKKTCALACSQDFDAFTSTLLYSRRQPHDFIAHRAAELAEQGGGATFYYRDFRPDWRQGIEISKEWKIYRQQYCGCIFSEKERYAADLEKIRRLQKFDGHAPDEST
ncbi:MAG: epoxyqueuosine reductase QueH [Deltaproteobacteria bacterium]|nr:epoxyqueuosine reductase QueH [Deltaproteobacteria bacterium]